MRKLRNFCYFMIVVNILISIVWIISHSWIGLGITIPACILFTILALNSKEVKQTHEKVIVSLVKDRKPIPQAVREKGEQIFESPIDFIVWYYSSSNRLGHHCPCELKEEDILKILSLIQAGLYWDRHNMPYAIKDKSHLN
jgi:hypothetical protein